MPKSSTALLKQSCYPLSSTAVKPGLFTRDMRNNSTSFISGATYYCQHPLGGQDPGHRGAGEGTAPERHYYHAQGTDTLGMSRLPNVSL